MSFVEYQSQDYSDNRDETPPHTVSTSIIALDVNSTSMFSSLRFFDKKDNCRSGTVVDRDVVHPTEFDFYLQSHGQRGPRVGRAALYSVSRKTYTFSG